MDTDTSSDIVFDILEHPPATVAEAIDMAAVKAANSVPGNFADVKAAVVARLSVPELLGLLPPSVAAGPAGDPFTTGLDTLTKLHTSLGLPGTYNHHIAGLRLAQWSLTMPPTWGVTSNWLLQMGPVGDMVPNVPPPHTGDEWHVFWDLLVLTEATQMLAEAAVDTADNYVPAPAVAAPGPGGSPSPLPGPGGSGTPVLASSSSSPLNSPFLWGGLLLVAAAVVSKRH